MRSERDKMSAGEYYDPRSPDLLQLRTRARELSALYNATADLEIERREALLRQLLGGVGKNPSIEPPFFCDYGSNIFLGDNVFLNTGCVLIDCGTVEIGNFSLIGPAVQIYTVTHPLDPLARKSGVERTQPVRIGANVWIGGGAILCPGVEIGEDAVIGAGSVVTRTVPAGMLAVGNPCRLLRKADGL